MLTDGGGGSFGLGFVGCLRLGAILAFLEGLALDGAFPFFLVSTMARVRVSNGEEERIVSE